MPVPSAPVLKSLTPNSRTWLAKHFRDPYVKTRLSHPGQFRSRSAFKLLELHEKYNSFLTRDVRTVVDLGAAPGGWSQVVAGKMGWTEELELESVGAEDWGSGSGLRNSTTNKNAEKSNQWKGGSWSGSPQAALNREKQSVYADFYGGEERSSSTAGRGTIVAADLLPIPPIPGVRTLQIDFLSPQAGDLIRAMLVSPSNPEGKADLILSDMAANFSGNKVRDTESSLDICMAVFEFVKNNLRTSRETGKTHSGTLLYVIYLFSSALLAVI